MNACPTYYLFIRTAWFGPEQIEFEYLESICYSWDGSQALCGVSCFLFVCKTTTHLCNLKLREEDFKWLISASLQQRWWKPTHKTETTLAKWKNAVRYKAYASMELKPYLVNVTVFTFYKMVRVEHCFPSSKLSILEQTTQWTICLT